MSAEEVARLQRRLTREKAARRQAETIAEKGLRDLFLANQNLDKTVTKRTLELQSARTELERSAERRGALLAVISRQVRTPLNGVVGMLDLLEDHLSDDQARSYLDSARRSSDDLLRLFSRLILFVELDDNVANESSPVLITDVLSRLTERWSRTVMASGHLLFVESECSAETEVLSVSRHLEMLLDELVDNVIKFCEPGTVTVSARVNEATVVLTITDPGPSAEALNRAGAAGSDADGMGLALAERLADVVGASIEIPAVFEGPSSVKVTLPLRARA